MDLSDEQKRLIEMKRQQAMAIREAKRQRSEPLAQVTNVSPFAKKSVLASSTRPSSSSTARPATTSSYFSGNGNKAATSSNGSKVTKEVPVSNGKGAGKSGISNGVKKNIFITLVSSKRLSISFQYDSALIAVVKKLRSSSYDQLTKKWSIALDDYITLIELLKEVNGVVMDSESVSGRVIGLMISERDAPAVDLTDRLPQTFIDNLFPFQREGAKFAIRRKGRCIIADDMGLGKTVQALAVAYWFKEDWPLIIVCPASVTRTWQQAILKWIDFVKKEDIEIAESPTYFPKTKIVIMSYDRLSRSYNEVVGRKANFVIFDESHSIKSSESQRARSAINVAKAAKRVILLSGTPALSRPMELYTQIFAVNSKVFPKKHDFGVRYCNGHMRFFGKQQTWDFKGSSNTGELRILLESTIMIRRLKKDVLQDLPRKQRIVVPLKVDLSQEEEEQNRSFQNMLSGDISTLRAADKRKELMEWYNSTAAVKIPAVVSYITGKLKLVQKLIVFAYHKVMVEALCEFLASQRTSYIVITGETPPKIRQDCCNVFQENPSVRVAVVSIVAAGVGITLTAANQVVFTELFWNPGILIQAEDRAHRIGQESKVAIEYLLASGTVDDVIWRMVGRKLTVLNKVGLSDDSLSDTASRDQNQRVIESYFKKANGNEEANEAEDEFEDDSLDQLVRDFNPLHSTESPNQEDDDIEILLQDTLEEETGVKFNGIVSFEAGGSGSPKVVTIGSDDEEKRDEKDEFVFDDDDDDVLVDI